MSVPTQLYRYLISGLTAFAAEYLLFLALHQALGVSLVAAHAISFSVGLLTSFTMQRLWSFGAAHFRYSQRGQFAAYLSLALFNLVFTTFALEQLVVHGASPAIAKPAVMASVAAWNFILMRKLIFRSHPASQALKNAAEPD